MNTLPVVGFLVLLGYFNGKLCNQIAVNNTIPQCGNVGVLYSKFIRGIFLKQPTPHRFKVFFAGRNLFRFNGFPNCGPIDLPIGASHTLWRELRI